MLLPLDCCINGLPSQHFARMVGHHRNAPWASIGSVRLFALLCMQVRPRVNVLHFRCASQG